MRGVGGSQNVGRRCFRDDPGPSGKNAMMISKYGSEKEDQSG